MCTSPAGSSGVRTADPVAQLSTTYEPGGMSASGGHSHGSRLMDPSGFSEPRPHWSWTSPGAWTRTTATSASIAASGVASARTETLTNAPGATRSRGTVKASSVWFRSGEMDPPQEARTTGVDARVARRRRPPIPRAPTNDRRWERAPAAAGRIATTRASAATRADADAAGIAAGTMETRAIVARPSGGTRSELAV